MSHPSFPDDEDNIMLKPKARRRNFDLALSTPSTQPSSPSDQTFVQTPTTTEGNGTPAKTKSLLNLTSSTLFGIYQSTGYGADRDEPTTPWGTGAETPVDSSSPKASFDFTQTRLPEGVNFSVAQKQNGQKQHGGHNPRRRRSTITQATAHRRPRRGFKRYYLPLAARLVALFGIGVLYGVLISHLHDKQDLAPVKVEGVNRQSGWYFLTWGVAGAILGEALPLFDKWWSAAGDDSDFEDVDEVPRRSGHGSGDWLDVVRAIGAFVGVAFAIRKTPWHSTLQLSLTLALANPALWYLLDRSPAGFALSTLVACVGTGLLLGVNPSMMPSPPAQTSGLGGLDFGDNGTLGRLADDALVLGVFSQESVAVITWIASVLFVSAVCFGNIGRRLMPSDV
ncbi:hypothetical protein LTR62_003799 [Meristemomyces frigidus]|uniref:Uncharacterized protein n=1 Tax=Meristemomyces frigidus TaxID=1508187 RepID=A0AAN7TRI7_9PEZI|nr:hypothetical protein LTR62_003799 [Meristemomyces frigidus]